MNTIEKVNRTLTHIPVDILQDDPLGCGRRPDPPVELHVVVDGGLVGLGVVGGGDVDAAAVVAEVDLVDAWLALNGLSGGDIAALERIKTVISQWKTRILMIFSLGSSTHWSQSPTVTRAKRKAPQERRFILNTEN